MLLHAVSLPLLHFPVLPGWISTCVDSVCQSLYLLYFTVICPIIVRIFSWFGECADVKCREEPQALTTEIVGLNFRQAERPELLLASTAIQIVHCIWKSVSPCYQSLLRINFFLQHFLWEWICFHWNFSFSPWTKIINVENLKTENVSVFGNQTPKMFSSQLKFFLWPPQIFIEIKHVPCKFLFWLKKPF